MASEEFGFLNFEFWLLSNLYWETSIQAPMCNYVLYKVIVTSSFLSIRVPNQKKKKKNKAVDENHSAFLLRHFAAIVKQFLPFSLFRISQMGQSSRHNQLLQSRHVFLSSFSSFNS